MLSSPDAPQIKPHLPVVSVITPAKNAARTISETLCSVQAQSYQNWELIVIDDGSTDATANIVYAMQAKDARIRYVLGLGQGVSRARNLGVKEARGSIIAFLDADDLWEPQKLEMHVKHLHERPDVGLSFSRVQFVDHANQSTGVFSTKDVVDFDVSVLLYENLACTASTLVVRRDTFNRVGGFDVEMRFAEDLELMIRVFCRSGQSVQGLDQVFTRYRASPQGASANLEAMQLGWEHLLVKVKTYAPELVSAHAVAARAIHLRYLGRRAARLGLPARQGFAFFLRAVRTCPSILMRQPRRTLGTLAVLLIAGLRSLTSRRAVTPTS